MNDLKFIQYNYEILTENQTFAHTIYPTIYHNISPTIYPTIFSYEETSNDCEKNFNIEYQNKTITKDIDYSYNNDSQYKLYMNKISNIFNKHFNSTLYITLIGFLTSNCIYLYNTILIVFSWIGKKIFITWAVKKITTFINKVNKKLFSTNITKIKTTDQKYQPKLQMKAILYDNIQELFSTNTIKLPCICLYEVDTVGELRKKMNTINTMNINLSHSNDSIVYEIGIIKSFNQADPTETSEPADLTEPTEPSEPTETSDPADLTEPTQQSETTEQSEHNFEYKKLVYFNYIDPMYILEAKTEIINILSDYIIEWGDNKELVIIPNNMLKFVKKIYQNISMKYSKQFNEFNKKVTNLTNQIIKLETELNTKEKQNLRQNIEILQLKLKLANK